jgi:hypothetical protein
MLHVWMDGSREMCDGYDESGRMSTIFALLSRLWGRGVPVGREKAWWWVRHSFVNLGWSGLGQKGRLGAGGSDEEVG